MDVGVYFDLRVREELGQTPARTYGFVLEACEEAERLGLQSVWLTEHHGFADGYLPQPLTFAAAVAARTRRIRIGTSVLLAPLREPVQLAEEAAVVDLVSGGRLDLGLGSGYLRSEFELFGVEERFARRSSTTIATAERIVALWRLGAATPAPLQDPFPLWIGASGPRTARAAGRLGAGLLRVAPALLDAYREGLAEGGHEASAARMVGPLHVFLTDDPERDWPLVAEHVAYQWTTYRHHRALAEGLPAPVPVRPDEVTNGALPGGPELGFVCGEPEAVAPAIARYCAGTPTTGIHFWASVGAMDEALTMRNIELAATRLAPLLKTADLSTGR